MCALQPSCCCSQKPPTLHSRVGHVVDGLLFSGDGEHSSNCCCCCCCWGLGRGLAALLSSLVVNSQRAETPTAFVTPKSPKTPRAESKISHVSLVASQGHIVMASPPLSLVLCCVPCYGHAKPLVLLAEHLAEAGHEVCSATAAEYRSPRMIRCTKS